MATTHLSSDLESYLASTGMTPTMFGRLAMGDPTFVFDLRKGRRAWPETEEKARRFMRANPPAKPRRAPAPRSGAEAA